MIQEITEENTQLSLDQCRELFALIRKYECRDDKSSLLKYNELVGIVIQSVEGMIKSIASKYSKGNPDTFENLIAVGRVGAFKAVQKYDCENYEAKFSTLANRHIEDAIRDEVRTASQIGYNKVRNWHLYLDMANHIRNISYAFASRTGRLPTFKELGRAMNMKTSTLIACVKLVSDKTKSLNDNIKGCKGDWLSKMPSEEPAPDEIAEKKESGEALLKVFQHLSTRELNTLSMLFGVSNGYRLSFEKSVTTYKIPAQKLKYLKKELLQYTQSDPDAECFIESFFEANRPISCEPSDGQKKALGIYHGKN